MQRNSTKQNIPLVVIINTKVTIHLSARIILWLQITELSKEKNELENETYLLQGDVKK